MAEVRFFSYALHAQRMSGWIHQFQLKEKIFTVKHCFWKLGHLTNHGQTKTEYNSVEKKLRSKNLHFMREVLSCCLKCFSHVKPAS